ncbi:MAG TPA: hypothetical protein DF383_10505 [Deltaproteobacteria bacterium]|nr:hypothetical protein [Deltaproteobacteria bacterium]
MNSLIVIFVAILDYYHALQLWHLYVVSAILSCLFAFLSAANFAILPQIVPKEELVRANSLQQFSMHSSTIVGAALGGGLVGMMGTSGAFLINGLLTLAFSLLVMFIRVSPQAPLKTGHWKAQMGEGFRYLSEERTLLGVMISFVLINLAAFPIFVLLPIFAKGVFGVGPVGLGWMEGFGGAGAIAAVFFLFRFSTNRWRYVILQVSLLAIGILFVLAGLPVSFGLFLFFLSAMGFCLGLIDAQIFSLFQIRVPRSLMGRVIGLLNMAFLSVQPLAYGIGGYLGDQLGARPTMMICGLGIMGGAVLFAFIPQIRKI